MFKWLEDRRKRKIEEIKQEKIILMEELEIAVNQKNRDSIKVITKRLKKLRKK